MKKTLIILTIIMMVMSVFIIAYAQTGTFSPHNLFYKPDYGASGVLEWETYNDYIDIADNQIWANKTNIEAIDLSLYYLKTEIDTLSELELIYGVDIIDATELSTYCETTQDYLKTSENDDSADDLSDNSINDLMDVITTGKSTGKLLKFDASGNLVVGDDEGGVTTFTGLTDTPANYTDAANKFLQVNGTPDAIIFDTIKEADISDLGSYLENVVEDTTPDLGGNLSLNAYNIDVTASLSSDHTYSGIIDSQPVGESVVFGQLLYFNWTDKEWKLAKADAAATTPALAIALESKTDGQTCKLLRQGYIRDDSWNFTAAMVYLSTTTAGGVQSTAPSTTGNQIQRVGQAKSADVMFFNPSNDVGEKS